MNKDSAIQEILEIYQTLTPYQKTIFYIKFQIIFFPYRVNRFYASRKGKALLAALVLVLAGQVYLAVVR
jgi:hypothetical protein